MLDKKNIYLIASVIVVLIISWQFTIKNTFEYKNELDVIGVDQLEDKSQRLMELAQQNRLYIKALKEKNIANIEVQETLFKSVEKKPSVVIKNYNNEIVSTSKNLIINYHQIELEGTYVDLISSLNALLLESPKLELLSFTFFKEKKNFRSSETLRLVSVLVEKSIVLD